MKQLLFLFFIFTFFFQNQVFSQSNSSEVSVIYIKDFSAKDYYTLLNTDEKTLLFTIDEACIPKGLLAIRYKNEYNEKQKMNYTQTVILKLIDKIASYTAYSVDDLRNSCAEYRKEIIDEQNK